MELSTVDLALQALVSGVLKALAAGLIGLGALSVVDLIRAWVRGRRV